MVKVTPTNFCRIGRRTFVLSEICGLYPRVYMVQNRRPIISKSSIPLSHRNNLNSETHDLIKVKINRKNQVTDKIKKKNNMKVSMNQFYGKVYYGGSVSDLHSAANTFEY
jgi:hypothetical protein